MLYVGEVVFRLKKGLCILAMGFMLVLALTGCEPRRGGGTKVLLNGDLWRGGSVSPDAAGPRVYVTLDGAALIDLPFSQAASVVVQQPDGALNAIALTGAAVYMDHANCENQDCVQMGAVTLENLELRVMGGFIICLPHKVSVEVRE